MTGLPLAFLGTGLVAPVGWTARACGAAFRTKLSNPVETRFVDGDGQWVVAHRVETGPAWRGLRKLAWMAALAVEEALFAIPRNMWSSIPLLLCVAETDRPGRLEGLENTLMPMIECELGVVFDARSQVVADGRVATAVALSHARMLVHHENVQHVLIAATDSLLHWNTVRHYDRAGRLFTSNNSNGFVPGEGAGALLVGAPRGDPGELVCLGLGFGIEPAPVDSGRPHRAIGLTQAIKAALADAGCGIAAVDFRVADASGEQYFFKEAALAAARLIRHPKSDFDLLQPSVCTGNQGSTSGASAIVMAASTAAALLSTGFRSIVQLANDAGERAALIVAASGSR